MDPFLGTLLGGVLSPVTGGIGSWIAKGLGIGGDEPKPAVPPQMRPTQPIGAQQQRRFQPPQMGGI